MKNEKKLLIESNNYRVIKICSILLSILFLGLVYMHRKDGLVDYLDINKESMLAWIVPLAMVGLSIVAYWFRVDFFMTLGSIFRENPTEEETTTELLRGNVIWLVVIVIELMEKHIFSFIVDILYRLLLCPVAKVWLYGVNNWNLPVGLKYGLAIIITLVLVALFMIAMGALLSPAYPIVVPLGFLLVAVLGAESESSVSKKKEDYQFERLPEIVETVATAKVLDHVIRCEVERQAIIEKDPMSEFR